MTESQPLQSNISSWTRVFEADLDDKIFVSQLNKLASAGILPEISWSGQIS